MKTFVSTKFLHKNTLKTNIFMKLLPLSLRVWPYGFIENKQHFSGIYTNQLFFIFFLTTVLLIFHDLQMFIRSDTEDLAQFAVQIIMEKNVLKIWCVVENLSYTRYSYWFFYTVAFLLESKHVYQKHSKNSRFQWYINHNDIVNIINHNNNLSI